MVVPYSQIKAFWRYWLYYLNPFTYLMQGLLQPVVWDLDIECEPSELTNVPLPSSMSCGEYMGDFLRENSGYVVDPAATASCEYCPYKKGADYLKTVNINGPEYGWRGVSFGQDPPESHGPVANRRTGWHHCPVLRELLRARVPDDEDPDQGHQEDIIEYHVWRRRKTYHG